MKMLLAQEYCIAACQSLQWEQLKKSTQGCALAITACLLLAELAPLLLPAPFLRRTPGNGCWCGL
jgi:hypothetical protein